MTILAAQNEGDRERRSYKTNEQALPSLGKALQQDTLQFALGSYIQHSACNAQRIRTQHVSTTITFLFTQKCKTNLQMQKRENFVKRNTPIINTAYACGLR